MPVDSWRFPGHGPRQRASDPFTPGRVRASPQSESDLGAQRGRARECIARPARHGRRYRILFPPVAMARIYRSPPSQYRPRFLCRYPPQGFQSSPRSELRVVRYFGGHNTALRVGHTFSTAAAWRPEHNRLILAQLCRSRRPETARYCTWQCRTLIAGIIGFQSMKKP
jgi:hypothetical protein